MGSRFGCRHPRVALAWDAALGMMGRGLVGLVFVLALPGVWRPSCRWGLDVESPGRGGGSQRTLRPSRLLHPTCMVFSWTRRWQVLPELCLCQRSSCSKWILSDQEVILSGCRAHSSNEFLLDSTICKTDQDGVRMFGMGLEGARAVPA